MSGPLKCAGCRKPLLTVADYRLGLCLDCYRPHSSPSCRLGYCSAVLASRPKVAAPEAK